MKDLGSKKLDILMLLFSDQLMIILEYTTLVEKF